MFAVGIDPGNSGGVAILEPAGNIFETYNFKDASEHEISDIFELIAGYKPDVFAYIEKVHSMPKQGVASSFTFGESFGFLKGMLTAHKIPYDLVTPQSWQKHMNCLTRGDKGVSKAKAQRLFPDWKITHANADAILIAQFCREKILPPYKVSK
jgi:crossover junction endodeoxyribonuclease RuvC